MWSEGTGLSFVEESIASRETEEEMVRCIQIGLLCIQQHPMDRPSIEILLSMLSRDIVELPVPNQPVFSENAPTEKIFCVRPWDQPTKMCYPIMNSPLVWLVDDESISRLSLYYPLYTVLFS
ncbi:hypothetical protein SASPL_146485 [Salvia splendens]|uniref:Uncharacterized protein n=1 Tax=Salvia splendens TaxID=180675 RepID=A0A8X8WCS3_SALSN|nr:hypothetical protein SASPL_146485 [Salvia splendens]